jgi:hypothetical protein
MQAENYSVGDYDGSIVDLSLRIFLENTCATATPIAPFFGITYQYMFGRTRR